MDYITVRYFQCKSLHFRIAVAQRKYHKNFEIVCAKLFSLQNDSRLRR